MVYNGKNNISNNAWWQPAMATFLRMAVWIGMPALVALFFGKIFDSRFGTSPYGLVVIVLIVFIFSIYALIKIVNTEYRKNSFDAKNNNRKK